MESAMATLDGVEHLAAIRARLQSVEDDLVAAGKRKVTMDGAAGVFSWTLRGAGHDAVERLSFADDIREVEDMIIAAAFDCLFQSLQRGSFAWWLRKPTQPAAG